MKTNKRMGVSLIVLVITIIVMIILAAAIILSLNGNNIMEKAGQAKTQSNYANMLQAANVAHGEYLFEKKMGELTTSNQTAEEYVKEKLGKQGFTEEDMKSLSVLSDGTVQILPKIPEGFVVSGILSEQKVSKGLVIYELNEGETTISDTQWEEKITVGEYETYKIHTERNQYVWIPVNDISEFKVIDWGSGLTGNSFKSLSEPYQAGYQTEIEEYNKMKASVEKYGGFYIARYEAGLPEGRTTSNVKTTDIPVSKKAVVVWESLPWGTSMDDIGTKGAVHVAKRVYPETENTSDVVSTLCYGVQWDAIMNFMKDVPNPNVEGEKYIYNGTGMGWTSSYSSNNPDNIAGKDIDENASNMVKNIYDMTGNVAEWTMEAFGTISRVMRGVGRSSGDAYAATYRSQYNPDYNGYYYHGFRVALYLK